MADLANVLSIDQLNIKIRRSLKGHNGKVNYILANSVIDGVQLRCTINPGSNSMNYRRLYKRLSIGNPAVNIMFVRNTK